MNNKMMSPEREDKLNRAKEFFDNVVIGWMIVDLKKSIAAGTNYLTTLGCLVYTEVIGGFLPPLPSEKGKVEETRFYRCYFRLESEDELRKLDQWLERETHKNAYQHLRHGAVHFYHPSIIKNDGGKKWFLPTVVAREAYIDKQGTKELAPPVTLDDKGRLTVSVKSYIEELERAVARAYLKAFRERETEHVNSFVNGFDSILRRG